jgi:hypothetical protein
MRDAFGISKAANPYAGKVVLSVAPKAHINTPAAALPAPAGGKTVTMKGPKTAKPATPKKAKKPQNAFTGWQRNAAIGGGGVAAGGVGGYMMGRKG